ncbi:hypothetical protein MMC07_006577 [Pseudocyphellaria aurata]|nr:hypothetical protein [Pseudocyphellaria aurata]
MPTLRQKLDRLLRVDPVDGDAGLLQRFSVMSGIWAVALLASAQQSAQCVGVRAGPFPWAGPLSPLLSIPAPIRLRPPAQLAQLPAIWWYKLRIDTEGVAGTSVSHTPLVDFFKGMASTTIAALLSAAYALHPGVEFLQSTQKLTASSTAHTSPTSQEDKIAFKEAALRAQVPRPRGRLSTNQHSRTFGRHSMHDCCYRHVHSHAGAARWRLSQQQAAQHWAASMTDTTRQSHEQLIDEIHKLLCPQPDAGIAAIRENLVTCLPNPIIMNGNAVDELGSGHVDISSQAPSPEGSASSPIQLDTISPTSAAVLSLPSGQSIAGNTEALAELARLLTFKGAAVAVTPGSKEEAPALPRLNSSAPEFVPRQSSMNLTQLQQPLSDDLVDHHDLGLLEFATGKHGAASACHSSMNANFEQQIQAASEEEEHVEEAHAAGDGRARLQAAYEHYYAAMAAVREAEAAAEAVQEHLLLMCVPQAVHRCLWFSTLPSWPQIL